jgi:hypothetical protein
MVVKTVVTRVDTQNVLFGGYWTCVTRMKLFGVVQIVQEFVVGEARVKARFIWAS